MALTDEQLEELRRKYGRVGAVKHNDHEVVFRKPTREDVREYRRMLGSPSEKHEAIESLAQRTIVAFDEILDPNQARTHYTNIFLESSPFFTSRPEVMGTLSVLGELVETEEAMDLGKGVRLRLAPPKPTPVASPNGSATAPGPPTS